MSKPASPTPAARPAPSRRELLLRALDAGLLLGGVGLVGAGAVGVTRFVLPPPAAAAERVVRVRIADLSLTGNPDGLYAVRFLYQGQPAIVVRRSPAEVAAFVAVCTHLHCVVHYDDVSNRLVCPCHQAAFDLTGRPVAGPPQAPLARLAIVKQDQEYVWVSAP
jgi:cytochrome b6-f complex iron-sulfur subunit